MSMHPHSYRLPVATLLAIACIACAKRAQPDEVPTPASEAARTSTTSTSQASTSLASDSTQVAREYRGAYTTGFEMSWFEPCDAPAGDRLWWVTLTDDALHQRDSLLASIKVPPTTGLVVRWRGTISPRMRAGQMGRGTRYMLVTTIVEIRPVGSGGACSGRAS